MECKVIEYICAILHYPLRSFPEKLKSILAVCVLCSYVNTNPVYTNKVDIRSYYTCYWLGTPIISRVTSWYICPPVTFLVHPSKCFFHGQLTAQVHLNTSYCPCTSVHVLLTVRVYPNHMLHFRYTQPHATVQDTQPCVTI